MTLVRPPCASLVTLSKITGTGTDMRYPFFTQATLAVSSRSRSSLIPLVRARTVSVTGQATFAASVAGDIDIEVYYSPDGQNLDTQAFGSVTLAQVASTTVQASAVIITPEHGWIQFVIRNKDASNVHTNGRVWYSIQSWDVPENTQAHGSNLKDSGED